MIPAVVTRAAPGPAGPWPRSLAVAMVLDGAWIARHRDVLRPLSPGDVAPEIALPEVGPGGVLGPG